MKSQSLFNLDIFLLAATLLLVVSGILFIYSSGISSTGDQTSTEYLKQIIWVAVGTILMFFIAFSDYSRLKPFYLLGYGVFLVLILLTLAIGREINGAKAWLGILDLGIQPSEFMKIATILVLAFALEHLGSRIEKPLFFLFTMLLILIPIGFILLQPDMGTALVFFPIFLSMTLMAGAKIRYLLFILISGGLAAVTAVLPSIQRLILRKPFPLFSIFSDPIFIAITMGVSALVLTLSIIAYFQTKNTKFYWSSFVSLISLTGFSLSFLLQKILKEYQIMRLIIFIDPQVDPKRSGWNIIQSVTAVGSGGLTGKGYLKGTQSHYQYLPQQSTDFIFSILSEEWGFVGGFFIFVLFALIFYRGIIIAAYTRDRFASLATVGIISMLFFHFIVNIGMTTGIMPITGIPLYFLSYGGSSIVSAMLSIGFLLSFSLRRYRM